MQFLFVLTRHELLSTKAHKQTVKGVPWNRCSQYLWMHSFSTKAAGCRPTTLQKMNSFTGCLLGTPISRKRFHWLLPKAQLIKNSLFQKYKLIVLSVFQFIKKLWLQWGVSSPLYEPTGADYCFGTEYFSIEETGLDLCICWE